MKAERLGGEAASTGTPAACKASASATTTECEARVQACDAARSCLIGPGPVSEAETGNVASLRPAGPIAVLHASRHPGAARLATILGS